MEATELDHMVLEEMLLIVLLRFDHQCHAYPKIYDKVEVIMNTNVVFMVYSAHCHLILMTLL